MLLGCVHIIIKIAIIQFYRPWPPSDITPFSCLYGSLIIFGASDLALPFFTPGCFCLDINYVVDATLSCNIGFEGLNLEEYKIRFSEDDVEASFVYMINRLKDLWKVVQLSKFKSAFRKDKRLSNELKTDLELADTLERLLDILSNSPFCTWLEFRILKTMAKVNISEATQMIDLFEKCVYCKNCSEALKHFKQQCIDTDHLTLVNIKLNKNPRCLVIADLIKHCHNLENIFDLQNLSAVLGSKTGCLEIYLVISKDHCMRAYDAVKNHFLKLRPLNIQFLQIGTFLKFYATNLIDQKTLLQEVSASHDNCKLNNYSYVCSYCIYYTYTWFMCRFCRKLRLI